MTSPAVGGGRRLGLALLVIATAQLMVVLDATIVNVALPHVQRALGFSGTGLEWVVNAYAVTFGGLLLLGGRAGDIFGRRRVFVNVPIGIVVTTAAPRVLAESPRRPGRIDVAGAVTGTGGIALLVYGLSKAATGADGVSHWGDVQVLASLAASVVLLVSFVLIERRSSRPLLPIRVLADRNRSGAYLIMLCVATGLFGLFFFLTLFIQTVLGYSAIRAGIAYLPFAVGVVIASALASQLVERIGPRPLIVAGSAMVAGGMFWFSRLTEHAGYASQLFGPQLVSSFGLGLVFVPLALVALHNVAEQDSGVASSLLALLIAIATIRVSRQELAGAVPEPQEPASHPAAPRPGTVQRHEDRAALAAAARPCRFC